MLKFLENALSTALSNALSIACMMLYTSALPRALQLITENQLQVNKPWT